MDRPTVFELSPTEQLQAIYKVIQLILLFKDPTASQNLGPATNNATSVELLKASFDKLIGFYPILQGHIEPSSLDGTKAVQVNEGDLKKQLFTTYSEKGLTVEEFQKVQYRRELWPRTIESILSDAAMPNTNRLVQATVIQFKNGCLVSLSVNHILVDVVGALILLEQWASLAKQGELKRRVDFDYMGYWNKLTSPPAPDKHPYSELTSAVSEVQARLAKDMVAMALQTHTIPEEGKEPTACILHVPKDKLDQLSLDFNKDSLDKKPIHGVQLLYALLWQRYVETAHVVYKTPEMGANEQMFFAMIHNTRGLIHGCADYIGNSVAPKPVTVGSAAFRTMPTIELARHIKSQINTITHGAAADFAKEIARPDGDLFARTMVLLQKPELRFNVSNVSRLPFFEIDFGNGTPEAVLWGNLATAHTSIWMPLRDGGIDVYLGLDEPMFEALPNDRVLSEYCQFVNR
ncbi:hypothetical protein GGI12_000439 [Dipsacomyces acuminosporus]|nr:hypothetical protein GGI12_000439 [Dipsacomyces acuminosporus]